MPRALLFSLRYEQRPSMDRARPHLSAQAMGRRLLPLKLKICFSTKQNTLHRKLRGSGTTTTDRDSTDGTAREEGGV